jgi:AraC-like DNA-binding protein
VYDHASSFPYTTDALQRSGPFIGIPALLAEFGVTTDSVTHNLALPEDIFTRADSPLPYAVASQLLDRCVTATGCPHFGLLLGARSDETVLGVAGAWLRRAPDLGSALSGFVALQHSNSRGASTYLHPVGSDVLFGYGIYDRQAIARDQVYALALAVTLNVVRSITGREDRLRRVLFPFRQPDDVGPFVQFFRAPLLFNQVQCAIVMPADALLDPVFPGAAEDFEPWLRKAVGLAPAAHGPWKARVLHALRPLLLRGLGRAPDVARHLGISARSLNRYLEQEGTSFQALLDNVRFTTASELLALTDLSIAEISDAVSFVNHSALVAAFHRWSGMTPSEWRRRGKPAQRRPGQGS